MKAGLHLPVMTAAPVEWRDQTARERELIETILLADFSGRDEIAVQLRGALVKDDCACGCGSFAPKPEGVHSKAPTNGVVFEAEGEDDAGTRVGLFIKVRDGLVEYVECWGMTADPKGLPRPETLRMVDIVANSETWSMMAPHARTIVEEAHREGATS